MQQDSATTRSIEARDGAAITVGLDVGDRYTHVHALGAGGEVMRERRVRTAAAALGAALTGLPPARVVLEAGPRSPWLSRLVADLGHEVVVANPRQVALAAGDQRHLATVGVDHLKWFLDLNISDEPFDASTFSKNRERLLAADVARALFAEVVAEAKRRRLLSADVARALFAEVVAEAKRRRLLSAEHFTVDGTLLESWASLKSYRPRDEDEPAPGGRNPDVD